MSYKIYRNEFNKKVCLCTQDNENKELFKEICRNVTYEIHLNGKNVTYKYRSENKEGDV